jgi:hypothetical protein
LRVILMASLFMCPRTMSIITPAVTMASTTHEQSKPALMDAFGEMWARNPKNIKDVRRISKGRQGIYILYDGSMPVYVGKGFIRSRVRVSVKHARRKDSWNHFSWYILKDEDLVHDVEVLLLRILPQFLRHLTRQGGRFGRKGNRPEEIKEEKARSRS